MNERCSTEEGQRGRSLKKLTLNLSTGPQLCAYIKLELANYKSNVMELCASVKCIQLQYGQLHLLAHLFYRPFVEPFSTMD